VPARAEGRLELRSLLAAVEDAPPVAVVDVFAAELGKRLAAQKVTFLIADSTGNSPRGPSQTTMQQSSTPRLRSSVSTPSQYFAPSPPSPSHSPRMSRSPPVVTPMAT
jgi:hypothetical protein